MRLHAAVLAIACAATLGNANSGEVKSYVIYDDQPYQSDQLESASKSPIQGHYPTIKNGRYVVHKSPDGHYYIPGAVNGYPIVWMVDTGASISVIPSAYAKNAGIRAALSTQSDTAAGQVWAATSENNELIIGTFHLSDAKVGIADNLRVSLLGSDSLAGFKITIEKNTLVLSIK